MGFGCCYLYITSLDSDRLVASDVMRIMKLNRGWAAGFREGPQRLQALSNDSAQLLHLLYLHLQYYTHYSQYAPPRTNTNNNGVRQSGVACDIAVEIDVSKK